MSVRIRLLGDSHGNMVPARVSARQGLTCVHIGDLGFERDWRKASRIPNLYVVAGNHDEIPFARTTSIYLGDFGDLGDRIEGAGGTFYLRGAESLDQEYRTPGKDWWPEEELSEPELQLAFDSYLRLRPHTVITHEAPTSIVRIIHGEDARPSRTSDCLQKMFGARAPARWYFGHHHVCWSHQHGGTEFRGLAIDEKLDVLLG